MITPEVIAYIQQELSLGEDPQIIKNKLIASGWSMVNIESAFKEALSPKTKQNISAIPKIYDQHEFNTLFHTSVNVFKNNYKKILTVQLLDGLFLLLIYLISQVIKYFPNIFVSPINNIFNIILGLSVIFITPLITLVHLYMLADSYSLPRVTDYFNKSLKNSIRYILIELASWLLKITWLILGIIMVLIIGKIIGLIFPFAVLFQAILVVIIVVGLFMMFYWFTFAGCVLANENTGIIDSLKLSRYYAIGNIRKIFNYFFLIGIMFFGINLIPIVGQIISLFIAMPFYNIFLFELYKKIRYLKSYKYA